MPLTNWSPNLPSPPSAAEPLQFLQLLEDAGLTLYELVSKGGMAPLGDKAGLIQKFQGRRYTNIVAARGKFGA